MAECRRSERKEGYSIEFRGVRTRYKTSEGLKASFRYAAGAYQSQAGDWVGLFLTAATALGQYRVRVTVSDPERHKACDGGLWKTGEVIFTPEALSGMVGGEYCLWYVRSVEGEGGRREVVIGRSDPFTVLQDVNEFPDIQLHSMDDHILVDTLKVHSPTSVGSSFVLVSDEDEMSNRTPNERPLDHTPSASDNEPVRECLVNDQLKMLQGSDDPASGVRRNEGGITPLPSSYPQEEREDVKVFEEVERQSEGCDHDTTGLGPTDMLVPVYLGDAEASDDSASHDEEYLQQLSLSESTVMVAGDAQDDVRYLKTNNRELRRKLRKLTEKLEMKERDIQHYSKELEKEKRTCEHLRTVMEGKMSNFERQLKETMAEKEHLLARKSSLEDQLGQLKSEHAKMSEQSNRIQQELEACQTKLQVERSERTVLEDKLVRTEKALEKAKLKAAGEKSGDLPNERRQPMKHRPTDLPLGDTHTKPSATASRHRPQHNYHPHDKERQRHRHIHSSRESQEAASSSARRQKPRAEPRAGVTQSKREEVVYGGQRRREMAAGREEGAAGHGVSKGVAKGGELSEGRIEAKLRGTSTLFVCPVCNKQLPARETEYSATLHVEHCLAMQA